MPSTIRWQYFLSRLNNSPHAPRRLLIAQFKAPTNQPNLLVVSPVNASDFGLPYFQLDVAQRMVSIFAALVSAAKCDNDATSRSFGKGDCATLGERCSATLDIGTRFSLLSRTGKRGR